MQEIRLGRYRHFKGNEYEVVAIAKHSETTEDMVVYKALYGDGGLWVRPASMWNEMVERDGKAFKRFEFIKERLFLWNYETMRISELKEFSISCNRISDGALSYDGNLLKKSFLLADGTEKSEEISVTEEIKKKIITALCRTDFENWSTDGALAEKYKYASFSDEDRFVCRFENGEEFCCVFPRSPFFFELFRCVDGIITDILREKARNVTSKALSSEIAQGETCWICQSCSAAIPLKYVYCTRCGAKRTW
ncbi:MAG: DUF1653 domain-containing protein [Clostridia bacterium]|nr:DUF1653 domain-containing protein [Clostridia bacterium]